MAVDDTITDTRQQNDISKKAAKISEMEKLTNMNIIQMKKYCLLIKELS